MMQVRYQLPEGEDVRYGGDGQHTEPEELCLPLRYSEPQIHRSTAVVIYTG